MDNRMKKAFEGVLVRMNAMEKNAAEENAGGTIRKGKLALDSLLGSAAVTGGTYGGSRLGARVAQRGIPAASRMAIPYGEDFGPVNRAVDKVLDYLKDPSRTHYHRGEFRNIIADMSGHNYAIQGDSRRAVQNASRKTGKVLGSATGGAITLLLVADRMRKRLRDGVYSEKTAAELPDKKSLALDSLLGAGAVGGGTAGGGVLGKLLGGRLVKNMPLDLDSGYLTQMRDSFDRARSSLNESLLDEVTDEFKRTRASVPSSAAEKARAGLGKVEDAYKKFIGDTKKATESHVRGAAKEHAGRTGKRIGAFGGGAITLLLVADRMRKRLQAGQYA